MSDCTGIGRIFGHNFEPRYSMDGSDLARVLSGSGDVELTARAIDALQRKTYVHDVCTRCGKTNEGKT